MKELVEILRGHYEGKDAVEVVHRGSIAVVDGNGDILHALGDAQAYVHLRSTAKPFQLLPLLARNIHKSRNLSLSDLALLMSSHSGEPEHIVQLREVMGKLQVSEEELLCGVHEPTDRKARNALLQGGERASVLHNNCSGKHCAMVATAREAGFDTMTYVAPHHPLQKEIEVSLRNLAMTPIGIGIDGCSAPTFIAPLKSLARLYAMLSNSEGDLGLLFEAGVNNPFMIAGTKRLDTLLIEAGRGRIFAKTGAEGVYAIGVKACGRYPQGLGIAFKVSDGDSTNRAREAIAVFVLLQLGVVSEEEIRSQPGLARILDGEIKNYRGITTGRIRVVFDLSPSSRA